jgi:hypothetical protein
LRKKKKAVELASENYTIFHALIDVMKEKEQKKPTSLLHRLKLRK